MKEGTASHTARSVAAHRLEYARIEAPAGDPAADEALSRDVAGDLAPRPTRMHEYLRARTAFFDRAVLTALDAGVQQVVIGGAGYDGRALRYARPDVRWFELDHPATQADKRERLVRLNLDTAHIRFVAADFSTDPIADPLIAVGLDPARPALFLLEGVAVYLERHVLERVLVAFREVAADGSTLAISVSTSTDSRTRSRFAEHVAALGEPARSVFTQDQADVLLAAAGWEVTPGRERPRSAGLLLARAATPSDHPERAVLTAPRHTSRPGAAPATAEPGPKTGPLSALLSQALVAFTIEADNEAEHRLPHRTQTYGPSPWAPADAPWLTSLLMWANCLRSLPDEGITLAELRRRARTGTNVLRVLTPGGVRTADIATLAGISSESVAMAMGVLTKAGLVTEGPDPAGGRFKFTRLTARGVTARDDYPALAADLEAHWRTRFGPNRVTKLRAALEPLTAGDPAPLVAGLAPYPDNWRARVKPAAVLPHYPMTLHRGGYPDGS